MIYIDNRQNKIDITKELDDTIKKVIDYGLKAEGLDIPYEISVIFIDNNEIKAINKEQRNIDKVTDVLSFPMLEYPKGKVYKDIYFNYKFEDMYLDAGKLIIGDIALSLEKAKEQSMEYKHSFIRETMYLTVHSVLHLLGYDHMDENEKKIMRRREEEILKEFDIRR